jgi:hypothetical protein
MRPASGLALGVAMVCLAACSRPTSLYDYPAWGFAAGFPSAPKLTETPASADGATPHSLLVESEDAGDDLAVFVIDGAKSGKSLDEFTDAAAPLLAQAAHGDLQGKSYVATVQTQNQAMGREVTITRNGHPILFVRIYQVGGRFYEVSGESALLGQDDPTVKDFLDSFVILPGAAAATNAP